MNKAQIKLNTGFTLIETLVALAIFAFSVVSIVVVTGQGINDVNYSKNKLSATMLADEGIELCETSATPTPSATKLHKVGIVLK